MRNVRKIGVALVDVNAQNSSLSLREPATQRALLDMIAGTASLARAFGTRLAEFQRVRRRLSELQCVPCTFVMLHYTDGMAMLRS